MNANEMTYGIEIECGIDMNRAGIAIGGYHRGTACPSLPTSSEGGQWKAEHDGSLSFRGKQAVEFVSPILKGAAGLDNIRAACAVIKSWNGTTNRTCGLHIHVGVDPNISMDVLRRLYRLVGRFENALYAVTGTPDRRSSRFCNSVKTESNKNLNWAAVRNFGDLRTNYECRDINDRYRILNIQNLLTGRSPTVEFRVFSGTLNPAKIAAWVQICLSIVQAAHDGWDADWDIAPSVLENERGETANDKETHYMCKWLWRWPSRRGLNYGELGHAVFTRNAAQKNLRQLAVRHDARLHNS